MAMKKQNLRKRFQLRKEDFEQVQKYDHTDIFLQNNSPSKTVTID